MTSKERAILPDDGQFVDVPSSFDLEDEIVKDNFDQSADDRSLGSAGELEREDRAARRKRHIRLFCFSCNRYEGHSVAARSRLLYSFMTGLTFGLYNIFGRFSCHCCGSVRLARRDYLNPRFWYRTMWLGGVARSKKSKSKSRSRRKG